MRVLQLGPLPPPHGGVQHNLVAIRRYLAEQGVPCEVVSITRNRQAGDDGEHYPVNWFQLLRLLVRLRYDILHLHIGGKLTGRLLALSLVCCLMPGSRTVLTFHSGGYPGSPEGRTASPRTLRGFIFRRFDGIIAVNEEIVDLFLRFGVPAERVRLILPYDLSRPRADEPVPGEVERFFERHDPVLITVGLLEPEYELPLQIDVLGAVRESHPDAGLVIVGSGSIEDGLRELIRSKPYSGDVMLCGDVPHPATLSMIERSDVFLRTTVYDGDAISVREALHLGTPVIATDTGMRPAGVRLIPLSDAETLRAAIEERLSKGDDPRPADGTAGGNTAAVYRFYRDLLGR